MITINVECYAGYKGNERPVRFFLKDRVLEVVEIEDRWYGPSARYFRVRANDGDTYVLSYNEDNDAWSLVAYRKRD